MLDRERERRAFLQEEEGRSRVEKVRQQAEGKTAQELALSEENKRFLEKLRIPEYLQRIVDEEGSGAVVWRLSSIYVYMPVPGDPSTKVRTVKKHVFLTGVVLVRDIEFAPYEESYSTDMVSDYGDHYEVWTPSRPTGYNLRYLEILGSAQEELILTRYNNAGMHYRHPEDPYHLYPQYTSDSYGFRHSISEHNERTSPFSRPSCRLILLKDRLNEPELQQAISGLYLDQPRISDLNQQMISTYYENWPFDRWVPEAEAVRNQIKEEKRSLNSVPVIEPQTQVLARPPGFWERFLKKVF